MRARSPRRRDHYSGLGGFLPVSGNKPSIPQVYPSLRAGDQSLRLLTLRRSERTLIL